MTFLQAALGSPDFLCVSPPSEHFVVRDYLCVNYLLNVCESRALQLH